MWGDAAGLDPATLSPGSDLVLGADRGQADELAHGVLLDDWLDAGARGELDREARRRCAAWLERRAGALTVAGVPLGYVHELELYADVFVPELRVVEGLSQVARRGLARVALHGVDTELSRCLEARLSDLGVEVEAGPAAAPPSYPRAFRRSVGASRRVSGALREAIGVPGRPRGTVLFEPYWHLTPVWRLLTGTAAEPVMGPFNRPALPRRHVLRSLRHGGWIGAPGAASRKRSERAVLNALEGLDPAGSADPLDRLLDLRYARLLAVQARHTLAEAEERRQAFAGPVKATVAYSDSAPIPRLNAVAARENGASVVTVQHGLWGHLPIDDGRPARILDGWTADHVAVWSEREAEVFAPHVPGDVVVTGDPGATLLAAGPALAGPADTALVLAQMTTPLSTGADARVSARHLRAALGALSSTAVRRVVVRPHPLDPERAAYARIGAQIPGLAVRVDASGRVEDAIAAAGICVGALSTATLQAAAMGVPTVLLDVTGMALAWPFDGAGAFPTARSEEELVELIGSAQAAREVALDALGARPDAPQAVADLVGRAAAGPGSLADR